MINRFPAAAALALALGLGQFPLLAAKDPTPAEARVLARDAYIYAYPMLENFGTLSRQLAEAKARGEASGFGRFNHYSAPFTPDDHDVPDPDIDTLRSWGWLDLRAEPWILIIPPVKDRRYHAVQLIDLYTFNFAYAGTRATGSGGGRYLIAGPNWKGAKPAGIHKIFRSETELVLALARTELKNPDDVPQLKTVQAGLELWPLSGYFSKPPPPRAPELALPAYEAERARNAEFIGYLNFLLQFCRPPERAEAEAWQRFAKLGIGPGAPFDAGRLAPELRAAVEAGIQDAEARIAKADATAGSSWNGLFGSRDFLKDDYLKRAAGARKNLYGDSLEELWADSVAGDGSRLSTLRFPRGELPPAKSFWSLTLYTDPERRLYANPAQRYAISGRTPGLRFDDDKGLTLYVGHASPGKAKEANWLPAPAGPYRVMLRIYYPHKVVSDGSWKLPPLLPLTPVKKK